MAPMLRAVPAGDDVLADLPAIAQALSLAMTDLAGVVTAPVLRQDDNGNRVVLDRRGDERQARLGAHHQTVFVEPAARTATMP